MPLTGLTARPTNSSVYAARQDRAVNEDAAWGDPARKKPGRIQAMAPDFVSASCGKGKHRSKCTHPMCRCACHIKE